MSKISTEWKLSAVHQRFSLPEALVFYMAKNPPSPEVYNKLIKSCKYFWLKNPFIVLNCLDSYTSDVYWSINGSIKFQKFEIGNVNEKLWIHPDLIVFDKRNQYLASSIISKIYRSDLTSLNLSYQTVSFDEFQKFTSSGSLESLEFYKTIVKDNDGNIVPIEKLIELLPKLQTFYFTNVRTKDGFQTITSETAANLIAIPHFHQIQQFILEKIPESFDVDAFFETPKVRISVV